MTVFRHRWLFCFVGPVLPAQPRLLTDRRGLFRPFPGALDSIREATETG